MNALTSGILLAIPGLLLVLELAILWLRRNAPRPKTISMVLRDARFHTTSAIYLLSGLLAHWYWLAPKFAPAWMGVVFWLIGVALFVWDLALINSEPSAWPRYVREIRDPPAWLLLGALAGRFLFPQAA